MHKKNLVNSEAAKGEPRYSEGPVYFTVEGLTVNTFGRINNLWQLIHGHHTSREARISFSPTRSSNGFVVEFISKLSVFQLMKRYETSSGNKQEKRRKQGVTNA